MFPETLFAWSTWARTIIHRSFITLYIYIYKSCPTSCIIVFASAVSLSYRSCICIYFLSSGIKQAWSYKLRAIAAPVEVLRRLISKTSKLGNIHYYRWSGFKLPQQYIQQGMTKNSCFINQFILYVYICSGKHYTSMFEALSSIYARVMLSLHFKISGNIVPLHIWKSIYNDG